MMIIFEENENKIHVYMLARLTDLTTVYTTGFS